MSAEIEYEYAALAANGRPVVRQAAREELEKHKREGKVMNRFKERDWREARLAELASEILADRLRRERAEFSDAAPSRCTTPLQVGLGAILCGDWTGELIGRDFTG